MTDVTSVNISTMSLVSVPVPAPANTAQTPPQTTTPAAPPTSSGTEAPTTENTTYTALATASDSNIRGVGVNQSA